MLGGYDSRNGLKALKAAVARAPGVRLALDLAQASRLLREMEAARRTVGPSALVARMRDLGRAARPRSPGARRRLARTIDLLDRVLYRREANCYRRALVRVALDRDAAGESFVLGLDVADRPRGHAWVEGDGARPFDVEFRV